MEDEYKGIGNLLSSFYSYKDDRGLKDYATDEQKKRDKIITDLLLEYEKAYTQKVDFVIKTKNDIYKYFKKIISALIFLCFFISAVSIFKNKTATDLAALITSLAAIVTLVFGTVNIIVEHVFPKNDEEYITKIVESIQRNDLENKKENLKALYHEEELETKAIEKEEGEKNKDKGENKKNNKYLFKK